MKSVILFASICLLISCTQAIELTCNSIPIEFRTWWKSDEQWIDMGEPCAKQMRLQIKTEFDASMKYLAMGSYFSRDTVNRPGFAQFFIKAAREEREHGIKLIEYLLMRGELTADSPHVASLATDLKDLLTTKPLGEQTVKNGVDALKDALQLEAKVTNSIRGVIRQCEATPNDYHLVDYLTGVYLEEQYHGQRELAGKISTLDKMMSQHGLLGEFLFDKKMLD